MLSCPWLMMLSSASERIKMWHLTFPEPDAFLLIASWTPSSISTNLNPFPWRSLSLVLLRSMKRANDFHEGLNWDCHTFLIYRDKLMTKEQIKAHHNFFIRRYKIDAHPVEWNHEACLHVQRLEFHMMLRNSPISCVVKQRHELFIQTIHTPMVQQEKHSRESFKRIVQDDHSIIFRLLKMIIFRTHEWDIVNIIHLWKLPWNQG